jgi:hypothetical protein
MKILSGKAALFYAAGRHRDARTDGKMDRQRQTDRQTDRYDEADSRFSQLCKET